MIILRAPNGEIRKVPEGEPYRRLDARGFMWEVVGTDETLEDIEVEVMNEARVEEPGIHLGDMIANLTKAFGIEPCSKCEQRRRVLNEIRQRGIKGTLKALREIK